LTKVREKPGFKALKSGFSFQNLTKILFYFKINLDNKYSPSALLPTTMLGAGRAKFLKIKILEEKMKQQKSAISEFVRIQNKKAGEVIREINKRLFTKTLREFVRTQNRKATEVVRGLNKFRQ